MSEPEATFDAEFEDAVLGQCLRDDSYLRTASRICSAHHFGTKERAWLWKVTAETWAKYRERPNAKLIIARARTDFKKDEERALHLTFVHRLLKTKPAGPKAALEQLTKFVRYVTLQLAMERGAEALSKNDLDAADKALAGVSRGVSVERTWTHIRWSEEFGERQAARKYEKEHPDEFRVIPTGIARLDKALGGGGRKGEVGLIMGTTGRGKSILGSNFTHTGISRGHRGVYFALEMPARQVATRQDARWSGMKYDQFKGFDFKPSELRELEERYKKAAKKYANMLHILSMPVRSADIRTIRAALDELKDEYDFTPDFLTMDSGDHLKSVDQSLDSFRLQQAAVYWDLKELAEELGIMVWSTVHAGREWAVQIATAEATSESYDKARIADIILSINDPNAKDIHRRHKTVEVVTDDEDVGEEPGEVSGFDSDEEGRRQMELFLAKYRDGVSRLKIKLDCDFTRMLMKEATGAGDEEAEAA